MKSNAAGQLLGYTLQFPRGLLHLLNSSSGDSVCIEFLGDVATLKLDGSVISEEDKSSIVGNPLTNKSTNLWKTFYNWIQAIDSGELLVESTRFILYCNNSGTHGIVDEFSGANNPDEASSAVSYAKDKLSDVDEEHGIWKYYNNCVNENPDLLASIVERFELDKGQTGIYEELENAIRTKHVPETQIEFILDKLSGWLVKFLQKKISENKIALVSWDEFDRQVIAIFDRSRKRELIDFTLQRPPKPSDLDGQMGMKPIYLKQLEVVDIDDDGLVRAVSDFLRADINRSMWIEHGLIDEDTAQDFENKLCTYFSNREKSMAITEANRSPQEIGKLLYFDCASRSEMIRDMSPPDSTISGTYHALANEPVLGWHPQWKSKFSKHDES